MWSLENRETGKAWTGRADGAVLYTSSGKAERAKEFSSNEDAEAKLVSDVWAKLKAGFVARRAVGVWLAHAGKGHAWLGSSPIASAEEDDSFYAILSRQGRNILVYAQENCDLSEFVDLPGERMVRSIAYVNGLVLANMDGQIHSIDPQTGTSKELTTVEFNLGGSLEVRGSLACWHDGTRCIVQDFNTGETVWSRELVAGMWEGHTPMLALDLGTDRVAYCVSENEIIVENFAGGQQVIVKTEPELTENLWLTGEGTLWSHGPYSPIQRYDLETGTEGWAQESDENVALDFDRERSRLAIVQGSHARVINPHNLVEQDSLELEYVVHTAGVAFTRNGLAVLTDRGSVGWYPLQEQAENREDSK